MMSGPAQVNCAQGFGREENGTCAWQSTAQVTGHVPEQVGNVAHLINAA